MRRPPKPSATKAIELKYNLAEAHVLLGEAEFNTWQWEPADKELKRAIELAPNDAKYHLYYGQFLVAMGDSTKAIEARALAHGVPQVDAAAGAIYYWARQYETAVELIRPAVESDPMDNFLLGSRRRIEVAGSGQRLRCNCATHRP